MAQEIRELDPVTSDGGCGVSFDLVPLKVEVEEFGQPAGHSRSWRSFGRLCSRRYIHALSGQSSSLF
jgi:hypothetical protein